MITHPCSYLAQQVSLSPDLCDQATNQLQAMFFHQYFLQKHVHKIITYGGQSFYLLVLALTKIAVNFISWNVWPIFLWMILPNFQANIYLLAKSTCHRNIHTDGAQMYQTAVSVSSSKGIIWFHSCINLAPRTSLDVPTLCKLGLPQMAQEW
jgi:hypothetical protein